VLEAAEGDDAPSGSPRSLQADIGTDERAADPAPARALQQTCSGCIRPIAGEACVSDAGPVCIDCFLELYGLGDAHAPFGGWPAEMEAVVVESIPERPETNRLEPSLLEPDPGRERLASFATPADDANDGTREDTTARRISDETYIQVAPKLLRLILRAGRHGFSTGDLARSMRGIRVTSGTIIAVARRLDAVLVVGRPDGRRGGSFHVTLRTGCESQANALEKNLKAAARDARRAPAAK
jgi:hypothetical protein